MNVKDNAEKKRLLDHKNKVAMWKDWGPYVSDRQWGTVREDYSPDGSAWDYFPHDHARSRAYRWGEDGIGGISDYKQGICFAPAFWNRKDPILKERYFGLTGTEGNHGEDVKEYYYYLDSTPTHSYMKMLYKYPQNQFPYESLVFENKRRTKSEPEFELIDTGAFAENRYFDIEIEYAKADVNDILIQIRVHNRGPDKASLDLIPQLWFRNTWSWHPDGVKPTLSRVGEDTVEVRHPHFEEPLFLHAAHAKNILFCENETNIPRIFGTPHKGFYKDGINDYLVHGQSSAINPSKLGQKCGVLYHLNIESGHHKEVHLRLTHDKKKDFSKSFQNIFELRKKEADDFYTEIQAEMPSSNEDQRAIYRQAQAGMLWSKQFYHYNVEEWLEGDPKQPKPPQQRKDGRNRDWSHLNAADVISMPDKWEYPWFAAWDLAFHCIALALIDPDFAKEQLVLMTREWFMHPNGQLSAYEWAFGDVNPPVHAWAAWRVFQIDRKATGVGDVEFLEGIFHKLILNFTWWINRKDHEGNNIFQGGFLGLDNIGVF